MKSDLLIISDLWGIRNVDWIHYYYENLNDYCNISFYDACELANLEGYATDDESEIHVKFLDYGIDNAVNNLLKNQDKEINILAFSIGGTIAWKASLQGLKVNNLFLISATRLRYETQKPNCNINLMYGEKDLYKPDFNWFNSMNLNYEIINNAKHEFYRDKKIAKLICKEIIKLD